MPSKYVCAHTKRESDIYGQRFTIGTSCLPVVVQSLRKTIKNIPVYPTCERHVMRKLGRLLPFQFNSFS